MMERASRLLPQVGVNGRARIIDVRRARESFGREPERLVAAGGELRQQVWNERRWADWSIEKHLQCARIEDRRTVELDTLFDVAAAYIALLREKTLLNIQRRNLELTRQNLDFAQMRAEVGSARINEVYRWESQLASNKEAVVQNGADVEVAETELNRILALSSLCLYDTEEKDLADLMEAIQYRDLLPYISTSKALDCFTQFQICQGWKNSPEMAATYAEVEAARRKLLSDKRAFWSPDLDFVASGEQRFVRGGAGVNPPQIPIFEDAIGRKAALTDWMVGFELTFPLFEGGGKFARVIRDRGKMRELCEEWEDLKNQVAANVRAATEQAISSYLSIDLAADATDAAYKNYDFVSRAYARGVVTILDLLDAQNTYLVAQENLATAQFSFALDLFRLMRAVGRFDFFLAPEVRDKWFEELEEQCGTYSG